MSDRIAADERHFVASQSQLMWRRFVRHKLAVAAAAVMLAVYLVAMLCGFFSPSVPAQRHIKFAFAPPQRVRLLHQGRLHAPFVYGMEKQIDRSTMLITYQVDRSTPFPIKFFVRGEEYLVLGMFPADIHFVGAEGHPLFLLGADKFGRDLLTRNLYAARVSLTVGLVGVALSFFLGVILGGISGYYGGVADLVIQRIIEFLMSLPTIPVWMALAAALPAEWSSIRVYFAITIILSVVGWTDLARVVRGKLLELREADFVMAAALAGATESNIIVRHLLVSFLSYLIVSVTLKIPAMILGETALSFLGLGIRPPAVSWGTLLQDSQNLQTIVLYPWLMFPGLFVIVTVLAFNFVGDGLRDAADPYK